LREKATQTKMSKKVFRHDGQARWNLRVFGGSSNPELSKLVAKKAGVKLGDVTLSKFANNETNVVINEVVRGQNIFIIQTAGAGKPHDHLMEVLFMVNACRLAAAASITVVMPLYFYSQADNKDNYRMSITGKLVANMLRRAGVTNVMVLDPRTPQLEGFFDMAIDTIKVEPLISHWIKHNVENYKNCVVMCPDEVGVRKVIMVADDLDVDYAVINSRRRHRADISDRLRRQMRHNRLNHQHMSDNWQIVDKEEEEEEEEAAPEEEEDNEQLADQIEKTLRFAEQHPEQASTAENAVATASSEDSNNEQVNGVAKSVSSSNATDDNDTIDSDEENQNKLKVSRKARKSLAFQGCGVDGGGGTSVPAPAATVAGEKPWPWTGGVLSQPSENEEHQFFETRISGDVKGKVAVLIDDVIDTGRGLKAAVEALMQEGAAGVHIWATHGVFSAEALATIERFDPDFILSFTVTNSIPQVTSKKILGDRLSVIDISSLIAEVIRRHHYCESVSMISGSFEPLVKDRKVSSVSGPEYSNVHVVEVGKGGAAAGAAAATPASAATASSSGKSPVERLRRGYRLSSKCWD